jgi:hypothetical protein
MLCGETVAVCCDNRTEHSDTLCGESVPRRKHTVWGVLTSQGIHTLCWQSIPHRELKIHCGHSAPHREHTDTLWSVRTSQGTHRYTVVSPYLTGNTQIHCVGRMQMLRRPVRMLPTWHRTFERSPQDGNHWKLYKGRQYAKCQMPNACIWSSSRMDSVTGYG